MRVRLALALFAPLLLVFLAQPCLADTVSGTIPENCQQVVIYSGYENATYFQVGVPTAYLWEFVDRDNSSVVVPMKEGALFDLSFLPEMENCSYTLRMKASAVSGTRNFSFYLRLYGLYENEWGLVLNRIEYGDRFPSPSRLLWIGSTSSFPTVAEYNTWLAGVPVKVYIRTFWLEVSFSSENSFRYLWLDTPTLVRSEVITKENFYFLSGAWGANLDDRYCWISVTGTPVLPPPPPPPPSPPPPPPPPRPPSKPVIFELPEEGEAVVWCPDTAFPGDTVTLRVEVRDSFTKNPIPSGLMVWFLGQFVEVGNPSTGVFEADIHIPENLQPGTYSVGIHASTPKGWSWSGSTEIRVSSPAPAPKPKPLAWTSRILAVLSVIASVIILIPFIPP